MNATHLENPTLENSVIDGWPCDVDMKVIDPGVVFYEDLINSNGQHVGGNVLVQKETLDRMARSMKNKPIVNWDHRSVDPKEFKKGTLQGLITSEARFNEKWDDATLSWVPANDGWYHATAAIWDESTKKNIQNGHSISCAYTVSDWGDGGTYHKVPYEKEVLNGTYTHIAVVSTPRYEGARIELLNSVQGENHMAIFNLFKKDKPEEKVEMDVTKTKVSIEGHGDIALSEMINSYKAANPVSKIDEMSVVIDGKTVSVKELKNSYLKNADMTKMEEEHKDGDHKENAKKNCGMCNSAASHEETNLKEKASDLPNTYNSVEDKMAKEEERKNADDEKKKEDEEKEDEEKEERKNSAARAAKLDEMRNKSRHIEMPKIMSVADQALEGASRYGSRAAVVVTK